MSYIKLNEEDDRNKEKINIIENYYKNLFQNNKNEPFNFIHFRNIFKTADLFIYFEDLIDKKYFVKLILNKEEELILKLKKYKEKFNRLFLRKNLLLYKKKNLKLNNINEFGLMKGSNLLIKLENCSINLLNERVFLKFILDGDIKNSNYLSDNYKNEFIL